MRENGNLINIIILLWKMKWLIMIERLVLLFNW